MRERLAQLARTKVAGVPLPVLFVVLVVIAAVIIHRRRVKAASAQDASNLDTSTPSSVGAMAGGGYAGQDYSFPTPAGAGDTVDTTGTDFGGLTNPEASDTTVTGTPTPSTSTAAASTPPKVSPAKSSHPAGHHPPMRPVSKPIHKAAAPPKKTTVHKAPVHTAATKPRPAPKAPPKSKAPAHKAPAHKAAPKKPAPKAAPKKPTAPAKGATAAEGVVKFASAPKPSHKSRPGTPKKKVLS